MNNNKKKSQLVAVEFADSFDTSVFAESSFSVDISIPFPVKRIVCTSAYTGVFDNSVNYTINTPLRFTLFQEGTDDFAITVPADTYSFADLATTIENAMNAVSGSLTYTVTANTVTNKYDFDVASNTSQPYLLFMEHCFENNVSFTLDEDGTQYVITVDEGLYNPYELATEIETKLNASGAWTYICDFDEVNNEYQWQVSGNGGLQPDLILNNNELETVLGLANGVNSFVADAFVSVNVPEAGNQLLASLLGFVQGPVAFVSDALSSPNIAHMGLFTDDVLITSTVVNDQPVCLVGKRFLPDEPTRIASSNVQSCFEYVFPRLARINGDFDFNFMKLKRNVSSNDLNFTINLVFYNH